MPGFHCATGFALVGAVGSGIVVNRGSSGSLIGQEQIRRATPPTPYDGILPEDSCEASKFAEFPWTDFSRLTVMPMIPSHATGANFCKQVLTREHALALSDDVLANDSGQTANKFKLMFSGIFGDP
jgi:hypothetical protein